MKCSKTNIWYVKTVVASFCSLRQNKSFMPKKGSRMNRAAALIAEGHANNSATISDAPVPGKTVPCSKPYVQPVGNRLLFLLNLAVIDRFIAGNASRQDRAATIIATDRGIHLRKTPGKVKMLCEKGIPSRNALFYIKCFESVRK